MSGWRTPPVHRSPWRTIVLALVLLLPAAAAARSGTLDARAIVTGTGAESRGDGLARALREVLAKRSGDAALLTDPRVDAYADTASEMVEDWLYLDRMSGIPRHDEQGTRDRPYDLVAHFAPAKVDAVLRALGETPWRERRPPLRVVVTIVDRRATYPLTADGDNDERHRQALLAAAERYGFRLSLRPTSETDAPGGASGAASPAALLLTGTIRWSDADFGWVGAWHGPAGQDWGVTGVSFDEAYRNLVQGAMAIASGHALPVQAP